MKKLILLSILLIVGCDNSTEPEASSDTTSIIGTWSVIEIKRTTNSEGFISIADENHFMTYIFNSDGSMSIIRAEDEQSNTNAES